MGVSQDDDSQLKWPFRGTARVRFLKSQQSEKFNGGWITIKFSIERPNPGSRRPLPINLCWNAVPEECIPGESIYNPSPPTSLATTIPRTLYIKVERITHHKT